jgi:hypothetical protein
VQVSDPGRGRVFLPESGQQLVQRQDEDGLRVWDLRRLRQELDQLGLDWEAQPYPAAPEKASEPLAVTVDYGDLKPGR